MDVSVLLFKPYDCEEAKIMVKERSFSRSGVPPFTLLL